MSFSEYETTEDRCNYINNVKNGTCEPLRFQVQFDSVNFEVRIKFLLYYYLSLNIIVLVQK